MARLNVLEYPAEILRGWPNGSAIEMDYASAADFGNGDIVEIAANNTVVAATDNTVAPAIVIRGANDRSGTNNLYTTKVPNLCLFSGYVVRTSKVQATNLAVGAQVGVVGGLWDVAATAKVGTVLEVSTNLQDSDGNTIPNVATILIK